VRAREEARPNDCDDDGGSHRDRKGPCAGRRQTPASPAGDAHERAAWSRSDRFCVVVRRC
jgi:hypothetical protein